MREIKFRLRIGNEIVGYVKSEIRHAGPGGKGLRMVVFKEQ